MENSIPVAFKREMPEEGMAFPKSCDSFPLVFAARNSSDEIREKSSSGGMFHALASWAISQGGVVYGCAFDDDLKATHIRCETLDECERCMGSKYSQSDMSHSISHVREDVEAGGLVLFTGTPCQVAAVKAACKNCRGTLIGVDIVCHGVPSPALFKAHLQFLERELGSKVTRYSHRDKQSGWSHVECASFENGSMQRGTRLVNSWKRLFYDNRFLRPSCYSCPYTNVSRPSDMTIADFWKMKENLGIADDGLGTSLVLVNSKVGLDVFRKLEIDYMEASIEQALPGNPMLNRPSASKGNRKEAWSVLASQDYPRMIKKYGYLLPKWRVLASNVKQGLFGIMRKG